MIQKGVVLVNGSVQKNPLYQVSKSDRISFSEKIHSYANTLGVLLIYKPRGVWTNCKQGINQKEVIDLLPKKYRLFSSIGRLDKDSEGLILFTNDGVYANRFLNSGESHERIYHVWTKRSLTKEQLHDLSLGIYLSDGRTKPCFISKMNQNCYEFRLFEGKNRQIRRMVEYCLTHVTRLKRVSFGGHALGGMVPGQFRYQSLTADFLKRLDGCEASHEFICQQNMRLTK